MLQWRSYANFLIPYSRFKLDDTVIFPLVPSLIYWIFKAFLHSGTALVRKTTDALRPLMPHFSSCTSIVVVGPFIWRRGERFGFEPSAAGQEAEMKSPRLFTNDAAFTVKIKIKKKYNIRQLWSLGSSICKWQLRKQLRNYSFQHVHFSFTYFRQLHHFFRKFLYCALESSSINS